jgi:dTDP-4-amino-4,6-dideoxygalactose transaminase
MNVPFVDLQTQYLHLRDEVLQAVDSVFSRTAFILGEEVGAFEREFALFCGAREGVGVASGCDALLWALKACGIGPGDEVITAANSYIATALAITAAGARPVLVDCLPDSYGINPQAVQAALTPQTRAIIPVHLYGQSADMTPLLDLAKSHDLIVIEDAAQAHGATITVAYAGRWEKWDVSAFIPGRTWARMEMGGR